MADHDWEDMVLLRRCAAHRQAEDYALTLSAMGISSRLHRQGNYTSVMVASRDAVQATHQLAAYDQENKVHRPKAEPQELLPVRWEVAMVYAGLLFFFFAAIHGHYFAVDWIDRGAMRVGLFRDGEWWRAFTALFLHYDTVHLFSNLAFGTLFLILLSQVAGAGMASLMSIVAGAAGNFLTTFWHASDQASLGASTAIFAALGTLTALQQLRGRYRFALSVRQWIPLAGGITLLGFLGFSGQNTDVAAHVFGFLSGLVVGVILALWRYDWARDHRLQRDSFLVAVGLGLAAWHAAL